MNDPTGVELRKYDDDGRITVIAGGKEFALPQYEYHVRIFTNNSVFHDGQPIFQNIFVRDRESGEAVVIFGTRIEQES